jgi:uncharacterized protein
METTVTEAEEKRYAELQQIALDAGLPVNLSDARGNSLLMLASYNGHL